MKPPLQTAFVLGLSLHAGLTITSAQTEIPEAEARDDLAAFAATYDNRASWQVRAQELRTSIQKGAGLDPLPLRTPLHAVSHSRRQMKGYSVENIYFESFPGFFVTGNLYRPLPATDAKPAGILCPHGHWESGRFREDMQARCGMLARMGALVFAYDMSGWQESTQVDHRRDSHVLTYQLWNSMRALDYLEEENADPKRLGITGASGGGTQTFLLAALDPRVTAAAPVVMVSAHFFGGCNCESGLPIHRGPGHKTNNAEISALMAPRPLLIVSCGADWTKNVPEVEFPYIRDVYRLYESEEQVSNAHFPDEDHDYGASKRQPVYRFFAQHLELSTAPLQEQSPLGESSLHMLEPSQLSSFPPSHLRPKHALQSADVIFETFERLRAR